MAMSDDEFADQARTGKIQPPDSSTLKWGEEPIVAEILVSSAGALLDILSPQRGGVLWNRADHQWLFRGQAEAVWSLLPSAQRDAAFSDFHPTTPATPIGRRDLELRAAFDFASYASLRGLEVPGDTQELRDRDGSSFSKTSPEQLPPVSLRAIFALAQHYGLPTRLLDWTLNPLIAAYFAAVGATRRDRAAQQPVTRSDGRFALWALEQQFLDHVAALWDPGVVLVTVPGSSNPNLVAQQGVFTLVRFRETPKPDVDIPALDELLSNTANTRQARAQREHRHIKMLYKFTLPRAEAPALLGYLDHLGVNASTVFPGHWSIVEYMREAQLRLPRPWLREQP